jgi:hypothetical protein
MRREVFWRAAGVSWRLQSGTGQAKEGRMKSLSLFALSTALLGLALTGCEKHSFEDTKGLHLEHGKHHDEGHGEGHGDAAHGEAAHAKEDHAKDAHGEKAPEAKPEATKEEPRKTGI